VVAASSGSLGSLGSPGSLGSLGDPVVEQLCGSRVVELSWACEAGLADVGARRWAPDAGPGPALVEPGTEVGELVAGAPLPASLPVVAGCGALQLAVLGGGGSADGVVTVVPGLGVLLVTAAPPADPDVRVTTADRGLWAARSPRDGVAAQVTHLEQAYGRPLRAVVLADADGPADTGAAAELALALDRPVRVATGGLPRAGDVLVRRALGVHVHVPALPG
jgi:hypothetical protein